MPDKEMGDGDGPSLELPSLFGRKKRSRSRAAEPEPAPEPAAEPDRAPLPEPVTAPVAEPVTEPVTEPVAATEVERTAPLPVATAPSPEPVAAAPRRVKERRPIRVPSMSTAAASVFVGALVGALGVLLTYLGLQGCEAVRGTDSCGGPGLLILVAIVVVMVVAGGAVLRALRVPDAGNLSFLGVGILSVVVLMFLIDQLFEPWIIVAIPLLSAAAFALAHWVTTRYVEDV